MKTKKLTYALFFISIILLGVACKKNPTEIDNPDIISYEEDLSKDFSTRFHPVTATSPITLDVDIDKDALPDIEISAETVYLTSSNSYHSQLEFSGKGNDIYIHTALLSVPEVGGYYYYIASLDKNTLISDTTTEYFNYNNSTFGSEFTDNIGVKTHIGNLNGKGDKYIGFKFSKPVSKGGTTHFGWMKVNISADNRKIFIKEIAYHVKPNTALKAGEK